MKIVEEKPNVEETIKPKKKVKLTNADDAIKDKPKRMKKVELPDA